MRTMPGRTCQPDTQRAPNRGFVTKEVTDAERQHDHRTRQAIFRDAAIMPSFAVRDLRPHNDSTARH